MIANWRFALDLYRGLLFLFETKQAYTRGALPPKDHPLRASGPWALELLAGGPWWGVLGGQGPPSARGFCFSADSGIKTFFSKSVCLYACVSVPKSEVLSLVGRAALELERSDNVLSIATDRNSFHVELECSGKGVASCS